MNLYLIIASQGEAPQENFWMNQRKEWEAWGSLSSDQSGQNIITFKGKDCLVCVRLREGNMFVEAHKNPEGFVSQRLGELREKLDDKVDFIRICFHAESYDAINELNNKLREITYNTSIISVKWYGYTSTTEDTCEPIRKLMQKLFQCKNFCKFLDEYPFEKKIQEIELPKKFHLLKHHIAHLFLPLDIDLQGIKEVKENQANDHAIKYLQDVLQNKDDQFYRQKLAKLQYMVAGKHVDFTSNKECKPVQPKEHEKGNLLPSGRAIYDLIVESGEKKIIGSPNWKALIRLCGLKRKDDEINNDTERNPGEGQKIYEPDLGSRILEFTCELDRKIAKSSIKSQDVEKVLDFFSKLNDDENGWEVQDADPKPIKSFHDWFRALINALENILGKTT